MNVSLEISMYPLCDDYCEPILVFIAALENTPEVRVERGQMSTIIYGKYDVVMQAMTTEAKEVFGKMPSTVFVMKLLGVDRQKKDKTLCE